MTPSPMPWDWCTSACRRPVSIAVPRRPESIREDSRAVPAEPWLALESRRPTRDPVSSMEPAEAGSMVLLDTHEADLWVSLMESAGTCVTAVPSDVVQGGVCKGSHNASS